MKPAFIVGHAGFGKGGGPTPFVNGFQQPAVGSLRYNTSQQGQPLPLGYGTQRVSINVLELWDFTGATGKGGKGGGGGSGKAGVGKKQVAFAVYVAMAIAQGPAGFTGSKYGSGGSNRIWSNDGIAYGPSSVGLNYYIGEDGQAPDSTFVAKDPNIPVLGYSGTVYVTGDPLNLGQSPALPNVSFEMSFLGSTGWWTELSASGYEPGGILGSPAIPGLTPSGVSTNFPDDCNPATIIVDLLCNPRYGAGYPAANLDIAATIASVAQYCIASSLGMSLLLDREQPAARWIEEICQLTVVAPFYSAGLLKFVPYATAAITGNGVTWTPNLVAEYSVDDRDLIDWGGDSDPVVVTRSDPSQATNWFGQEYYDSSNSFNPNIAYQINQGAIDQFGTRSEPISEAHSLTNLASATASTQLQLQRKQNTRTTYKFQLGWPFMLLDPMDIVDVTDVSAGMSAIPVRITSIEEDDNGQFIFEAENLPGIATLLPAYSMQVPASQTPNTQADPGNANAPIIFEPNAPLSANNYDAWIISSGDASWGGANVWVSTDGTTYALAGTIYAGARQGVSTAILSAFSGSNPDTGNTLSVDVTESLGQLNSGSSTDAANSITLCYIDGELLAYEIATLTSLYNYNLTTLYRGLFGTVASSHSSGSQFAYLGLVANPTGVFKYNYAPNLVGATIYIKLQSFNNFLQESQSLSSLTPYTYTLTGQGVVNPTNVPFSFNGIPQNGVPVLNYTFGSGDNFPTNLTGSVCTAAIAATTTTTFTIFKNGTSFGTMTIAATHTSATFSGTSESFVPGDIVKIVPNRTDATLSTLTGNLAGTS